MRALLRSLFSSGRAGLCLVQAARVFPEELPQPLLPPVTGAEVPMSSGLEFAPPEAFPARNHLNCSGSLQRTESVTS